MASGNGGLQEGSGKGGPPKGKARPGESYYSKQADAVNAALTSYRQRKTQGLLTQEQLQMVWTCKLIENPELYPASGSVDVGKRRIGDMWFLDLPEEELRKRELSDQYWRENAQNRKPLVVLLPGKWTFLIDGKCFSHERGYYDGWTVTGSVPLITVSPSINLVNRYHGWLRDGIISDDVDGRAFNPELPLEEPK